MVVSPLTRSIYLDLILHRADTRVLAKEYLDRVAPAGSVIVLQTASLYMPPLNLRRYRVLSLKPDPSLLHPAGAPADFYLFNSFDAGRVKGISEAHEQALMQTLDRLGFVRVTFSPLRDGGELPFELDQVYLPYRHLFRYERPGPTVVVYARPGTPPPVRSHPADPGQAIALSLPPPHPLSILTIQISGPPRSIVPSR